MEWRSEDLQKFAPIGIEIKQSIFAWNRESGNPLNNVIFIRYIIEQKGILSDTLKNVLFGIAADPDLGNHNDDLVGCVPFRNLGYAYNDGDDPSYGINPPSFGILLLKGPEVFIPGETFLDNNSDGIYNKGVDTPLQNAIFNHGSFLGSYDLAGAANINMSAFVHGMSSSPTFGDPYWTRTEFINYLQAKNKDGSTLSVVDWYPGNGDELGTAADTIPFHFMYSGDPVAGTGWLNDFPFVDSRTTVTVGPFDLVKGETKEIVYAYVIGRGTDALDSITEMKKIADAAQKFYDSNFTDLPVSVPDKVASVPRRFELFQNYPNPFNPITKIKYAVANVGTSRDLSLHTTLKVYDVLGEEIATLVNEIKPAGTYEVEFDASSLSSGVYFYELRVNDSYDVKKMTVLK